MSRKQGRAAYDEDYGDDYGDDDNEDGDDTELLNNCYDEVAEAVGVNATEDAIVAALRACSYKPAAAIAQLLRKSASKKKGSAVASSGTLAAPGPWACSICTYVNGAAAVKCEMCESGRPASLPSVAAVAPPATAAHAAGPKAAAPVKAAATAAGPGSAKATSAAPPPAAVATVTGLDRAASAASHHGAHASAAPAAPTKSHASAAPAAAAAQLAPLPLPPVPDEIRAHYAAEDARKPRLSVVTIGHVDAGKSTLMGHLLYDVGVVSRRQLGRFARDAREAGKASFAFAWVLDAEGAERERGVTVDVATNHFETAVRGFTLLDAPGHRDFVPNTISALAQADAAVLVLDATPGEFEMSMGGGGQAREHALLARNFGVSQLVVAVNKMDGATVRWSQARFDAIVAALLPSLVAMGFKRESIACVPVSGLTGINLVHPPTGAAAAAAAIAAASASAAGAAAPPAAAAVAAESVEHAAAAAAVLAAGHNTAVAGSGVRAALDDASSSGGSSSSHIRMGWPAGTLPDPHASEHSAHRHASTSTLAGAAGGAGGSTGRKAEREHAANAEDYADMLADMGLSAADARGGGSTLSRAAASEGGVSRASTASADAVWDSAPTATHSSGGGGPGLARQMSDALSLAGDADASALLGGGALPEALRPEEVARLTAWYAGPTLLQAMETLRAPPRALLLDRPLRLCVSDVYRSQAAGVTVAGRIEGGFLQAHTKVMLVPGGDVVSVKHISINGRPVPFAAAGDNVDVALGGLDNEASLRAGQVLCWPSHPIRMAVKFKAQLACFPTLDMPLLPGQQFTLHTHTAEEPAYVTRLLRTLDRDGHTVQVKPRFLGRNALAVVRVSLARPVCIDTFADHRRLGRFMLRYGGQTVAAGMILKIKR